MLALTVNEADKKPSPSRGRRAFLSLLIAVFCVILAGLSSVPAVSLRPRYNSSGQPIFRPDGRPAMERDYIAELAFQWPFYSLLGVGAFFIARAAVIRFSTSSTPRPNDGNA